jgi:UDP-N-acetylmuramate--alanine ligase
LRGKVDPVYVKEESEVQGILSDLVRPGDIILTQGAGSVGSLAKQLAKSGFKA